MLIEFYDLIYHNILCSGNVRGDVACCDEMCKTYYKHLYNNFEVHGML